MTKGTPRPPGNPRDTQVNDAQEKSQRIANATLATSKLLETAYNFISGMCENPQRQRDAHLGTSKFPADILRCLLNNLRFGNEQDRRHIQRFQLNNAPGKKQLASTQDVIQSNRPQMDNGLKRSPQADNKSPNSVASLLQRVHDSSLLADLLLVGLSVLL